MCSVARKDDYAVKGRHQVSEIRRCQALTQDKCQPALKAAWPLRRPKLDRSAHNPQKMLGSRSLTGSQLSFHSGIALRWYITDEAGRSVTVGLFFSVRSRIGKLGSSDEYVFQLS